MRKQLMPMIAIACYVLVFSSNRPKCDMISNSKSITPILVAKSYNDELNFKKTTLTKEQIDCIVADVQKKEKEEKLKQVQYQKDLYLLSQVVYSEAGSDEISDDVQLMVANVVMNRVISPDFSDTIYDVVHAPNQYQFIKGKVTVVPNKRASDNAKKVLDGLRVLPKNIVYQSEYRNLGKIYKTVKTRNSTMYFSYRN